MCEKCDKLVNIPSNKKALQYLVNWEKDRDGLNDAEYFKMFIEVNHNEYTEEPEAFIKSEIKIDSSQLIYGQTIDIKYCPFCGRKLYKKDFEESEYLEVLDNAKRLVTDVELSIGHKAMTKKELEDKMFVIGKLIKIENLIEQSRNDIREGRTTDEKINKEG